jgi:hypothetical protein
MGSDWRERACYLSLLANLSLALAAGAEGNFFEMRCRLSDEAVMILPDSAPKNTENVNIGQTFLWLNYPLASDH